MQNVLIPTCYFPSTVLFLDDNRDFLLNFVLQIDESVAYRTFDNPTKALDFIHNKPGSFEFLNQSSPDKSTSSRDTQKNHASEFAVINAEVYNPNRFAEVSVVVVDYAMPGMDGLEFCRRIENPNIKKILLTGQADEKLAVEAFNEGLIHRYVKKNDDSASELITKSICELQKQYFQLVSDELERAISIHPPQCLKEEGFANLFHNIMDENGIVEYYLASSSGSFFMLDEDANTSFFIVKNESEMDSYHQLALSHGVDQIIVEPVARREKIPGLLSNEILNKTNQNAWGEILLPASELRGHDTYYYAYLKGNNLFNVRQQKILSYNRYLEELDGQELLMD